jgi:maltase-glucoamylase
MLEVEEKITVKKTKRTKIGIAIFLLILLLILIAIALTIFLFNKNDIILPSKKPYDFTKLNDNEKSRINCFLEEESKFENLTQFQCESRGCIYTKTEYERVPTCYFDRTNLGYILDGSCDLSATCKLKLNDSSNTPFFGAIQKLNFKVEYLGANMINVRIDTDQERYEVPYKLNKPSATANEKKARVEIKEDSKTKIFSFKVIRNSDEQVIFDTSFGGFVYCDQFIQISTNLNASVFGFGENNHETLQHDVNYTSWGMFARDNAPGWGVSYIFCYFIKKFKIY